MIRNQAGNGDAVSDDSTSEPLSRPPSREGKPVSWFRQRQGDPELVDRLKKYQELSDMGDVISSSVRSMGLAKDAIRAAQEVERMIERSSRGTSGGDAPSTSADRVVSGSSSNARRSTGSSCESANGDSRSHSGGRSTSHTFPSGSSRSSESRRIIMPESVSHLIPDNIGGMYLDKQNNIWIKKKGQRGPVSHVVPCDDSEEDPFASIPDLTVDITKELRQLKTHSFIEDEDDDEGVEGEGEGEEAGDDEDEDEAEDEDDGDDEREPKGDASCDSPSLAQLHEDCTDQARNVGMAARAVGELRKLDPLVGRSAATKGEEPEQRFDRSYEKMRVTPQAARRRNLTISFSSPIASIIQDMLPEDLDSLDDDPVVFEGQGAAAAMTPSPPPRPPPPVFSSGRKMGQLPSRPRKPPRFSPARRSFIPRPVSRIDEQEEEESTVELGAEIGRDNQLSVIHDKSLIGQKSPDNGLTVFLQRTPSRTSLALQNDDSLLIGQNIGRLSLTPLSEFTLNHPDQSFGFEVSYVMDHRHMATGNGSKRVLSMTIRELVDKLAEVEPYEPYWEDLTQLDLHDKQLTSLHMLDEFCGKVTALDASGNALPHLEGIPSGVRQLKVSHNMLTELTSWNHLLNLQYVDISGNEVKSLSALRGLVHLRSLRADQNRLTSLDGLDSHDGLLSLRARHNLIEELDLRKTRLERLEELDLEGNCIETVRGLEALPALVSLNLSGNQLERLVIEKPVRALRSLIVSDNDLASLDIRNVPNLQTLHVDGNRIQELTGFRYVRRIDSLSMREQRTDEPLNLGFLSHAYEVRKLFLSGNYLKSFEPRADFLNLQLLELANCGLQSLPAELGQMMPNLRALNLNFNAISDLSPLQYIPRLKKLFVAGNRLVDSTLVTELLTDFPHLTQLDMRDNPITQGFYPPLQVLVNPDKVGGSGAGAAAAAAAAAADPFMLTGLDPERDSWFFRLLDEPTKLRRRLHEVVFVASCKRLRKLDGLPIERGDILARDPLLQALIDEGLVPELDDTLVADSSTGSRIRESLPAPGDTTAGADGEADERESSRWQAEDSFA
ncbi:Septation initiation network scaffold protein cdc11 [Escovopsis weberi]|uniref:Septation initiation network scaffold protein cdc11 n=1 Tax=Escovopsis weberi TaxID=150374 RepID=A0A0M8N178_ESCWE|nr:Septation initiation network scaffold protein cdc11 [Escovopsis weberi]